MGSKILLADDSITIQKVVNLTFAEEGIEVVAVSNGDMAERRLEEVNPDLVLADIFMPGKNGYELCEAIKNNPRFSKVPVVLLIGAFEPFNEAEARRVRADAHLTKPFESRTLVETVRRLIVSRPRTGPISPESVPAPKEEAPRITQPSMERAPVASGFAPPPGPSAPAQAPSATISALDESAPLDFDYSPADALVGMPSDAQILIGEPDSFEGSSDWRRQTDDLSFGTDPAPFQPFGLDDVSLEASDSFAPVSVAVEPQGGEFPRSAPGAVVPSAFRNTEGALLDFDKPEQIEDRVDFEEVAFNLDSREPFEISVGSALIENEEDALPVETHSLKTTMLEKPSGFERSDKIDTNPLAMPNQNVETSDTAFNLVGMDNDSIDASSLLGVDEPLGDVLRDESAREGFSQATEQPLDSTLGNEALSIEFNPREESEPAAQTGKMTASATSDLEIPEAEHETLAPVASIKPDPNEWQPLAAKEFAGGDAFDVLNAPVDLTGQREPEAAELAGCDANSVSAPAFETEERTEVPSASAGGASEEQANSGDSGFANYSMWSEEETRFAPIDIEATPIDEQAASERANESAAPETGFDFALVAAAEQARSETAQPMAEPVAPQTDAAAALPAMDSAGQAVELSPALIDEIVRRVVAQMSEATVREIAWEVVPDCVERVIKDMTRQELHKRA
jgi:CheY-like chemotaxis protein